MVYDALTLTEAYTACVAAFYLADEAEKIS